MDALTTAPGKDKFREAVRKEVLIKLMEKSHAFEPITEKQAGILKEQAEADGRKFWEIGTFVNSKR